MSSAAVCYNACVKTNRLQTTQGAPEFAPPPAPFPADEYSRRITRLRRALAKRGVDGAIVTRDVSRRYLTGFDSSAGTLVVSVDDGAVFIVDFRYIVMARKAMPFARCVLQKRGGGDALASCTGHWRSAGFENRDSKERLERLFAKSPSIAEWRPVDADLDEMRSVKSPRERAALRKAIAAGDALYAHVLPRIAPGMTEWDIRNLFRAGADRFGHGESFDTIVCAGRNGAECHHRPDATLLRRNSSLLMDFGVVLNGYHSDMTRCVAYGDPGAAYKKIFGIVLEANRRAIAAIRPGMTGAEVDAVARRHIAKAGYGDAFGHSLGHSVGMEIHEGPNFSQDEKRVIRPGMVVTVEPGIYLPGRLGVRIEDVILVTDSGCEVLTKSPRTLEVP